MDEKLEHVLEQVNKNFQGNLYFGKGKDEELMFKIHHDMKYVEFIGAYKTKAQSMKELKPFLNYMKEEGYKSNLD